MKNLKSFILGSIAGCGMMFAAMQYHLIRSHDGFRFIPRTPQTTLGLAWADVRDWDAQKWSDRPQLTRALVAHGSSDLISESVANDIRNSLDSDSGTIGQLRSLLNGSLSAEFDAPVFTSEDHLDFKNSNEDGLAIPFPHETHSHQWDESLTDETDYDDSWSDLADRDWSRSEEPGRDSSLGFGASDDYEPRDSRSRRSREGYFEDESSRKPSEWPANNQFSKSNSSTRSVPRSQTRSRSGETEARLHETTTLEDLLFSDENENVSGPSQKDSGFNSVTRALDSRAARSLDRVDSGFRDHADSYGRNDYAPQRRRSSSGNPHSSEGRERSVPNGIRSLREGQDPFLK
ncbi:MAG: hypothetical protein MK102_01955 [Fuerstiella sp.]|nr:hypothetical protein [Fuerstiella sp.]